MPLDLRILRLSSALYWLCSTLLVLLPAVVIGAIALGWADRSGLPIRFPGLPDVTSFTTAKTIGVTALASLGLIPMALIIWQMRALFDRYRHGEILTEACARHILRVGQGLVALAVLLVVTPSLQILLLTYDNPGRNKILSIGIDGSMVGLGLTGALLLTIGWVMRAATTEIESFV